MSAVEDTLRDQKAEATPAGYFAALLSLLRQAISNTDVNKDLATSVVYLLDVITPFTPQPLLRSKFSQILINIAPVLTFSGADAPLLRPSIGCLESLLVAQDSTAWDLGHSQIGPRRALAGLLVLAVDHRPKIRRRAQEAVSHVLKNPPLSVAVDHPAADMCAETALLKLDELAAKTCATNKNLKSKTSDNEPSLLHTLQLVKTIAVASSGWPARKIDFLCEALLNISRSNNNYLKASVFEVFQIIFESMACAEISCKLPRLLDVLSELRPSQNDSQLLPSWIALISRGYLVAAKVNIEETFLKLPELFNLVIGFLSSSSSAILVSASECLISFMKNCLPDSVILEPSMNDKKVLEKLGRAAEELLSIKYQAAWPETFNVMESMFDSLRWQAEFYLVGVVRTVGELRESSTFSGKNHADKVIGRAIKAIGPEGVLNILPLNLTDTNRKTPGRAWMLPLLRDNIHNTNLQHFKKLFIPMSELIFQRVIDHQKMEKTMEIKIFETIIQQIWALFPGYCDLPLDLIDSFDQKFAELLSNLLYSQVDLRSDICKALKAAVESNKAILSIEGREDLLIQNRIPKEMAQKNIDHLSTFSSNMLAVLFNVYSQTLPQYRGHILQCINTFLSITPAREVKEVFERVNTMLSNFLFEMESQKKGEKEVPKSSGGSDSMPPSSHTLMDLVIELSIYLPYDSYSSIFNLTASMITRDNDPQLQKKAYKIIPRISGCNSGKQALRDQNTKLQEILIANSGKVCPAAKKNRLAAISALISTLPSDSFHFIPTILSEVIISCKETNEKARATAFDLLILMGEKMANSPNTLIENSKIDHMPDDAQSVYATLEEYLIMVSAGLAGSTPHMQSACVTALTRILFHFHDKLMPKTISGLVETLDIYLASNNREIVRSVLGFVKVCVISLPTDLMIPRLQSLVPNLMVWSHEHKSQFKAKVKHIIERMIRRFGIDLLIKHCPNEDQKLISNIRKAKERQKRHKQAMKTTTVTGDKNGLEAETKRNKRFDSEYDEAIYDSYDSATSSDNQEDEFDQTKSSNKDKGKAYIVEDGDEPLDLLDRRALASISSTKPTKKKTSLNSHVTTNSDGKLLLNDAMAVDQVNEIGDDDGDGIDAYVKAIRGRDAAQRGRGGRLKFSNKRSENKEDEMDIDQDNAMGIKNKTNSGDRIVLSGKNKNTKGGKMSGNLSLRRGLDGDKRNRQTGSHLQNGRVAKTSRKLGRGRR